MKKTLLTLMLGSLGTIASAQTIIYEIPFSNMVGCELTTGDICTGFVEECKRDDNPLAAQWGGTWTSTGTGIASTVDVELQYTINDITSIPTLLNGVANTTQTAPVPFCAGSALLNWSVDPSTYVVGGSNTFLLDYSATTAISQIDDLFSTGGSDIYMRVTVTYMPCTAPTGTITSFKDVTCNGGSDGEVNITPSGGTPPYTFDWDNDGTGDFDDPEDLTGLAAGTYNVVIKESGGCTVMLSHTVNEPAPIDVNVTAAGGTLTADAAGLSYQWVLCPGMTDVAGATNQDFTPTENGDYAVIITDGPCEDTSACTTVTGVGIDEHQGFGVILYPNPTDGNLNVSIGNGVDKAQISVLDVQGRVVENKGEVGITNAQITLNLSHLESGTYLLRIQDGERISNQKFTIK